jgi:hypothetical protein
VLALLNKSNVLCELTPQCWASETKRSEPVRLLGSYRRQNWFTVDMPPDERVGEDIALVRMFQQTGEAVEKVAFLKKTEISEIGNV